MEKPPAVLALELISSSSSSELFEARTKTGVRSLRPMMEVVMTTMMSQSLSVMAFKQDYYSTIERMAGKTGAWSSVVSLTSSSRAVIIQPFHDAIVREGPQSSEDQIVELRMSLGQSGEEE